MPTTNSSTGSVRDCFCDGRTLGLRRERRAEVQAWPALLTRKRDLWGKVVRAKRLTVILAGLLVATTVGSQPVEKPGATGASASSVYPDRLTASWRSLASNAPIQSVTVMWDGQSLTRESVGPEGVEGLLSERTTVRPSEDAWGEFWRSLEWNKVWQWARDYSEASATDGRRAREKRAWSVNIERGTNHVHSAGTNAYPHMTNVLVTTGSDVMYYRFWHAMDRLLGRPIEVEGRYQAGFEASRFRPSTALYRGQVWWLVSNKEFSDRYRKLSPERGNHFPNVGTKVMTRVRGRLVGPGRYGHLNGYKYEFLVDEVLEMKKAP